MKETAIKKAIDLNGQCVTKFKQKKFEEAITIGLQALEILLQIDADSNYLAIVYYNLGSAYLKLYESPKPYFGLFSLSESNHLKSAHEYLKKALAAYAILNNLEASAKTEDKINACLKHTLWNKLTWLQRETFKDMDLKPIHIAVLLNDFLLVKDLYARNAKCLEQVGESKLWEWPPLVYALFLKASPDLVNFLIEKCPQFLLETYRPLPFTLMQEYYSDSDQEDYDDKEPDDLLDESEYYPPIYYALVRPKIISNLTGTWSNNERFNIIKLLITAAPKQLEFIQNTDEEENCCALVKSLACKLPEDTINLLIEHTPQQTLEKSKAINMALNSQCSNETIKLLFKHTPNNVLEDTCVLVDALKQNYPKNIIEFLIDKNPNNVKKADLEDPLLFVAIHSRADMNVIEMLFEKDPDAALKLAGDSMLGYWEDDDYECVPEWVSGYNVTSLIMALYVDRFDIAAFLLQQRPELIAIKDQYQRLPISYINLRRVPLDFLKAFLPLSLPSLYKDKNYQDTLDKLLTHDRKEIVLIALKLGLAIGVNLSAAMIDVDTTNSIVIGLSIAGKAVTRQTPGFSQSITNLEELTHARNHGHALQTDKDYEHTIKLTQLVLLAKKQDLQKKEVHPSSKDNKATDNHQLLSRLEKWLILSKPSGSLTHLCLRFMRDNYPESKINEIKDKLPEPLFEKLQL